MQVPRTVTSDLSERIYKIVKTESPEGITSRQLSQRLGKSPSRIRMLLNDMHDEGRLKVKPADFEPNTAKVSWIVP